MRVRVYLGVMCCLRILVESLRVDSLTFSGGHVGTPTKLCVMVEAALDRSSVPDGG